MARRMEAVDHVDLPRVGGGWWLIHGLPLLAPGIGCVAFALLVAGVHAAGGGDPLKTPLLTVVVLALGAALTWFMQSMAGDRKHFRWLMVATGAIGTANLTLGLIVGFEREWMAWAYGVSSLVVWVLWGVWRGSKYAGGSTSGPRNQLLDIIEAAPIAFSKARMDERGVVRAKVTTLPGGTLDDAHALIAPLAAHAQAVPGGSHLAKDPDRDGRGEIEIPTRDNLKRAIPWPGLTPELCGITPTSPFSVGEYQTGPAQVQIVGDVEKDRNAHDVGHVKIAGVTGSGKSTGAQTFLGSMMGMSRLTTIGVDLSTELQIFGPLAGGLTWLITDEQEGRLFMERIQRVVEGRKAHLATERLKRWAPRSTLNLMLVWFEESKALARYTKNYVNLVSDARAAGIWIVSSTQSWIYRALSTDLRKQHPDAICFGMTEAEDVGQVLPDSVIEALGKRNLPTWGKSKAGYCYAAGIGIPEHRWPKMLRMYDSLDGQLREAVRVGAPFRDPMDQVTERLFGELFARRIRYDLDGRPAQEVTAARESVTVPEGTFADLNDQEEAEGLAEELNAQDRQEMLNELAEARRRNLGDAAEARDFDEVDPTQPIDTDADDDGEEDDGRLAIPPVEAQRIWDEKLDALYHAGAREVTTRQLTEWLVDVKRERTFLARQRRRWEQAGCITPNPDATGWDLIASPLERRQGPPHGE